MLCIGIYRQACQDVSCDYLFMVDSVVHFDHPDTLQKLITLNRCSMILQLSSQVELSPFHYRTILAPLMLRPGTLWSSFWGTIASNGFYARSADYHDLVSYKRM